tara:strand:- start:1144 stop:1971 length:828 start_codon:yes stop_codon:yes gene_type:complete
MTNNKNRKPTIFQLVKMNPDPATQGRYYPISYRLPSVDEIFDEETGTNRKIKYVIGEQSIFEDEQTSKNPVIGDIVFNNGQLIVPFQKPVLRKFLEASNYNQSNENRIPSMRRVFETLDFEKEAKEDLESLETEFQAIEMAMNVDPQEMVALCRVLGINTDRSMYEIKHDFMRFVKHNPFDFIESLSDPRIERKQVIMEALDNKIIVQNNVKRTVDWGGKNGQTISITPIGIDPIDNFIDFTFEKDGEEVYKRVVAMLDGKLKPKKDTSKKAVAK